MESVGEEELRYKSLGMARWVWDSCEPNETDETGIVISECAIEANEWQEAQELILIYQVEVKLFRQDPGKAEWECFCSVLNAHAHSLSTNTSIIIPSI